MLFFLFMVKLIFTLFFTFIEVIIFYVLWCALDFIFLFFLCLIQAFCISFCNCNMFVLDYVRSMYLVQKLSVFFEESFFFLFSEERFPRIVYYDYLKKNKPRILFFHNFKNRLDLEEFYFMSLKFLIKQFNFFVNSFFFKIKAEKDFLKLNFFDIKINMFFYFYIFKKFFFKRYYRFISHIFYDVHTPYNLISFDFIFFIFLHRSNGFLTILDLKKFSDWCLYHKALFKVCKHKIIKNKIIFKKKTRMGIIFFRKKKIFHLKKMYFIYKKNYAEFTEWMLSTDLLVDKKKNLLKFKNIFLFRFKNIFFKKFNNTIKNKITTKIKFSDSSMNKYINYNNLKNFNFFFLRKNRIFNKSRYSRNRQLYRTGFYWCLWLNIIIVYGLFFLFYRFTFNFGYIWWGLMFLFYSFIFSKVCKYNFYNVCVLVNEFKLLLNWFGFIIKEFLIESEEYSKHALRSWKYNIHTHDEVFADINNKTRLGLNVDPEYTNIYHPYVLAYKLKIVSNQIHWYSKSILKFFRYLTHPLRGTTSYTYESYPEKTELSFSFLFESFKWWCNQVIKFGEFTKGELLFLWNV